MMQQYVVDASDGIKHLRTSRSLAERPADHGTGLPERESWRLKVKVALRALEAMLESALISRNDTVRGHV